MFIICALWSAQMKDQGAYHDLFKKVRNFLPVKSRPASESHNDERLFIIVKDHGLTVT